MMTLDVGRWNLLVAGLAMAGRLDYMLMILGKLLMILGKLHACVADRNCQMSCGLPSLTI